MVAPASNAPSPRPDPAGRGPWLYGPVPDLLVGCGAWSLPLLALTFWLQRIHAVEVAFAFYLLAVFCNNPHYMATIYRAYHTAEDFKKYRFFTVYVTVMIALTVVLTHLVPGLFPWAVTLYITWSPWHYTAQNFGIAQMMIRRTGAHADPVARHLLYGSYVASFAMWFLTLHAARDQADPYFLSLGIPAAISEPSLAVFALIFAGCSGVAFVRLARTLPLRGLVAPLTLTVTQLLWFVLPTTLTRFGVLQLPASYFSAGALAFMHCAQYLWITSHYARGETTARPAFSFARYYLLLVIGGIALFVPGPWMASRVIGRDFVESFLIFMALVNLHHFILDGAVWKLRDGRIARLLLGPAANRATVTATHDPMPDEPSPRHHLGWLFGASRTARVTRYALGAAILLVGALDQWQYRGTLRSADRDALALAEVINPQDTRVYFRRAQLDLAAGNIPAAHKELAHILAINPRNAPAQHLVGELLFKSGDTTAALAHYDRMAALFRPDAGIAINRGLLAVELNRDDAAQRLHEALRLSPHSLWLHIQLAQAYTRNGDLPRAIAQYELFIRLFEEQPTEDEKFALYLDAGIQLGELLDRHNTPAAAELRWKHTADVAATHRRFAVAADALNRLARLQEKQNRTAEAAHNRALAAQAAGYAK